MVDFQTHGFQKDGYIENNCAHIISRILKTENGQNGRPISLNLLNCKQQHSLFVDCIGCI